MCNNIGRYEREKRLLMGSKKGYYHTNKECWKKYQREYYQKHKEERGAYWKIYRKKYKGKVKKYQKKYRSMLKNKRKRKKYQKTYYHQVRKYKYLEKIRARQILKIAIKKGKIKKPFVCSNCKKKIKKKLLHGHHKNYSKPLQVKWVCPECHGKIESEGK